MTDEPGYTTSTWKGLPRFACDQCPYDSLHEERVIEHIARAHAPRARRPLVQPYDAQGRPIEAAIAEAPETAGDGEAAQE